jgi:hypothetical protein
MIEIKSSEKVHDLSNITITLVALRARIRKKWTDNIALLLLRRFFSLNLSEDLLLAPSDLLFS